MQSALSIEDLLSLPELRAGGPQLIAGADGLQRLVRWAHVVAGSAAVRLLDGGELVLTTGAGWPQDGPELIALANELVSAAPAGIVLELGRSFTQAPAPLVAACERANVPLVTLAHEVRFVQITQRVHQRILAAQTEALSARAEVHAMLTELGLNRSPVDYVVERLAETLDAPVVLEDSLGRVVAWAGQGSPEQLLAPWAEGELPADSEQVHVEAQGRRWGRITALPGPEHAAGRRTVLELGAFALALGRLADPDGEQWLQLASKRIFDALLDGRYRRDSDLAAQLTAAGLPVEGRVLLGATLTSRGAFESGTQAEPHTAAPLERAVLETALRRAVAPEGRVILAKEPETDEAGGSATHHSSPAPQGGAPSVAPRLLALLSFPPSDPRGEARGGAHPELARRLDRELSMLLPATVPPSWRAHLGLGAAGRRMRTLITSLERVRAAGALPPAATIGRVSVQQAELQPLAYLVRGIAALPEVQEFAGDALGPLIEHDAASGPGHSGDLLRVLSAYLEHPTNRSLAAQQARLSRSVFYQRIALIEELLGVDLAAGQTIATLSVALLARR